MYIATEKAFKRSAEDRTDGALMLLETFNRNSVGENDGASRFIYDLYNLAYAFFQIRTMMAKCPESVPRDSLLRKEVSRARRNILARYPRLLNERIVNEGFNALESLFDLTVSSDCREQGKARLRALAVSHFFQNTLHNVYVGSRFGLLDIDRLLEKYETAPVPATHSPTQRLLI